MQALTFPRHLCLILIALIVLGTTSCLSKKTLEFVSPSGRNTVELWQARFDESWDARVDLISRSKRTTIYKLPREAFATFVHVYWSPDESRVSVIGASYRGFAVAVDTSSGRKVPFELVERAAADSLRAVYNIAPGQDPIAWTTTDEASDAFRRRYPKFRPYYWRGLD